LFLIKPLQPLLRLLGTAQRIRKDHLPLPTKWDRTDAEAMAREEDTRKRMKKTLLPLAVST